MNNNKYIGLRNFVYAEVKEDGSIGEYKPLQELKNVSEIEGGDTEIPNKQYFIGEAEYTITFNLKGLNKKTRKLFLPPDKRRIKRLKRRQRVARIKELKRMQKLSNSK